MSKLTLQDVEHLLTIGYRKLSVTNRNFTDQELEHVNQCRELAREIRSFVVDRDYYTGRHKDDNDDINLSKEERTALSAVASTKDSQ